MVMTRQRQVRTIREYIPVIMYSPKFKGGHALESDTTSSIGATIDNFNVTLPEFGKVI